MTSELLTDVTVVEREEREHRQSGTITGEAEINLEFDGDVKFDVDSSDDGTIIVQYWRNINGK